MVLDCNRIEQHASLSYEHTLSAEERKILKGTQLECRYSQTPKPVTIELWTGKKNRYFQYLFHLLPITGIIYEVKGFFLNLDEIAFCKEHAFIYFHPVSRTAEASLEISK